jgi:hypothetical protein
MESRRVRLSVRIFMISLAARLTATRICIGQGSTGPRILSGSLRRGELTDGCIPGATNLTGSEQIVSVFRRRVSRPPVCNRVLNMCQVQARSA